ncbi:glucan phosphoethanolaminetransferase (alkaline phosphatase superfamily) [Algibacter amylolyticus]|nr:glucan phosphoethanolaminetransferase (alkaline phosphatase superfamily) [Algibacter amylolyticus]
MNNILLESAALGWYIILLIFLVFGLPTILLIVSIAIRQKKKNTSNVLLIITAVYAIIGLGICGSLMF